MAKRALPVLVEEWKPVPGWPEYEISNHGRVKRVAPRRGPKDRAVVGGIRKPSMASGYPMIRFTRPGESQAIHIHRLVAFAFLGTPPEPGMQVNHLDSNRANPRVDNLEWATCSRNIQHGYNHGHISAKGSRNGYSKLSERKARHIRKVDPEQYRILAKRYGVSLATIRDVAARRTWQHIS